MWQYRELVNKGCVFAKFSLVHFFLANRFVLKPFTVLCGSLSLRKKYSGNEVQT